MYNFTFLAGIFIIRVCLQWSNTSSLGVDLLKEKLGHQAAVKKLNILNNYKKTCKADLDGDGKKEKLELEWKGVSALILL